MATKWWVSIVYFGFGYIVNNYCFSISLFCMIEFYYYFFFFMRDFNFGFILFVFCLLCFLLIFFLLKTKKIRTLFADWYAVVITQIIRWNWAVIIRWWAKLPTKKVWWFLTLPSISFRIVLVFWWPLQRPLLLGQSTARGTVSITTTSPNNLSNGEEKSTI